MGEIESSIFIIGSPDVDILFSNTLPSLNEVKLYYEIPFDNFAIAMFHPVTTEIQYLKEQITQFIAALEQSNKNYVVIYPNNDMGSSFIIEAYQNLKNKVNFRVLPSLRFEYFVSLLKHAQFIIGNSSSGIYEAPYFGVPTINVGTRQQNRIKNETIINTALNANEILEAIASIKNNKTPKQKPFGKGNSAALFLKVLVNNKLWNTDHQKQFKEL